MSELCLTNTTTVIPIPPGNFEDIFEFEQATQFNVTIPEGEPTFLVTTFDPLSLGFKTGDFLKRQLEQLDFETDVFWRINQIDRDPQFVIDIIVTIPHLNRRRKFAVLSKIGELMRTYSNLLFDFRTTGERNVPEGYTEVG